MLGRDFGQVVEEFREGCRGSYFHRKFLYWFSLDYQATAGELQGSLADAFGAHAYAGAEFLVRSVPVDKIFDRDLCGGDVVYAHTGAETEIIEAVVGGEFFDGHEASGLRNAGAKEVGVEGFNRVEIEHISGDSLDRELVGGGERVSELGADDDDGNVATFADADAAPELDVAGSERDAVRFLGEAEIVNQTVSISLLEQLVELDRAAGQDDDAALQMRDEGNVSVTMMAAAELRVVECAADGDEVQAQQLVAEIQLDLLVGALSDERGDGMHDRDKAGLVEASGHVDDGRFADADVIVATGASLGVGLENAVADVADQDDEARIAGADFQHGVGKFFAEFFHPASSFVRADISSSLGMRWCHLPWPSVKLTPLPLTVRAMTTFGRASRANSSLEKVACICSAE